MFTHKRIILALILSLSLLTLTGCIYRPPVQQGTILTDKTVRLVHRGMTRRDVIRKFGKPVLMNIYHDGRLVFIYTLQPNHEQMQTRQFFIYFRNDRVAGMKVLSSPNLMHPK